MNDEPEDTETEGDEESEGYTPEPVGLSDGDLVILDPLEFEAAFNCYAVRYDQGTLFILCRDTRKWVPVEGRKQTTLRSIQ